jgi:hypothetical protein
MLMKHWVVAATSAFLIGCSSGGQLVIVNEADVPLRDVVVSGTGFSTPVGTVEARSKRQILIYPRGESGLRIVFNADGKAMAFEPQGYFEAGGSYRVIATVSPRLEVTIKSELR